MSEPVSRDELTLRLARAFDLAWNSYYRPGRRGAISESLARTSLAKQLIKLAKDGVSEEGDLAEGGLRHLVSLTPEPWGQLRIERAGAKFVRPWRIRVDNLGSRQNCYGVGPRQG
jgi:hypothetical protein